MRRWIWFNSPSLVMFGAFVIFVVLQAPSDGRRTTTTLPSTASRP